MDKRSLAGYSPRGRKELDTTERLTLSLFPQCRRLWLVRSRRMTASDLCSAVVILAAEWSVLERG